MTLKEEIADTKSRLEKYKSLVKDLNSDISHIEGNFEAPAGLERTVSAEEIAIVRLCEIQRDALSDKIASGEAHLEKIKKEYILQFEKMSAECNMHMDKAIEEAKKHVGEDPIEITSKISDAILSWEAIKDDPDQEIKNNIFYELSNHLDFLKNKYVHEKKSNLRKA